SIFFFQAEDGIRDRNVTGVQTCALPILGVHREQFANRVAFGDALGDPAVLFFLPERRIHDVLGDRGWDDDDAVGVGDDDVAGLYGRAAAGDGEIVVPRHVPPSENSGVGTFGVDGHADRAVLLVGAPSPVGSDPGGAVVARADRADVPQGAGFDDAAGLDHEDLAFLQRVERALLRVVAAAVGCEQVLSVGDVAQRLRGAH